MDQESTWDRIKRIAGQTYGEARDFVTGKAQADRLIAADKELEAPRIEAWLRRMNHDPVNTQLGEPAQTAPTVASNEDDDEEK